MKKASNGKVRKKASRRKQVRPGAANPARPSHDPQDLSDNAWYYEGRTRIDLIYRIQLADGSYLRTDTIRIPWRRLEASLKRCRATR